MSAKKEEEVTSLRQRHAGSTTESAERDAQVERGAPLWDGATSNDVSASGNEHSKAKLEAASPDENDGGTPATGDVAEFPTFAGDLPWSQRSWWYELRPFRGMYYDVKRRLPFVKTDWTSALNPRNWWTILQYIPRMYFIK